MRRHSSIFIASLLYLAKRRLGNNYAEAMGRLGEETNKRVI